ncbi:MAG: serine hydrolase [Candidatus Eremiobacteraeota bacterium]|nr:serine hydrolase [Candidatus Eremiobacteraeota bacterium]
MRPIVTVTAAALLLCTPSVASAMIVPGPLADLRAQLASMSTRAPGHVAMEVRDLDTGLSSAVNPTASMPAASTIKIPVMVEVFRQLAAGNFDMNTPVTLRYADKDWGSGSLCDARTGTSYKVVSLLRAMIDVSDNTATNMLIRLVGRPNVNEEMASLGLLQTYLRDYIRTNGSGIRYALRSSPRDMVKLLTDMAKYELIDEWSSREMIGILEGQRHNTLIPEPLPSGLQIAHKTGTLEDTLNDVGIVYADPEIYVIAVMTTDLPSLSAGRRFIRRVSSVAYHDLQRFGLWRQNNGDVLNEAAPNGSDSNTMQDESGTPSSAQPQPGPTSAPR